MDNNEIKKEEITIDNSFTLDDEFAPKLYSNIPLGNPKDSEEFIIIKVPTQIPGEINVTLLDKTAENINEINSIILENQEKGLDGIKIIGTGTVYDTNIAEIMYGLNFATRNIYRSSIGDLAKKFTDTDKEIRLLMNDGEAN